MDDERKTDALQKKPLRGGAHPTGAFVVRKTTPRPLVAVARRRLEAHSNHGRGWLTGERAVAARRNAQETRRARARIPRVDDPARARRLERACGSNARHIRRGAGFSFSFRDPARRQISQRKRNYSGRTWTLRAALTFLRAAADLETRRGGWMSVRDRRNRRERRVAPGRAVPAAVVSSEISRLAARPPRRWRRTGVRVGERARHALELGVDASELVGGERRSHSDRWRVGGGCGSVARAPRRVRKLRRAFPSQKKKHPPFFRTARGCDFGACQMARDCAKWAAEKRFRARLGGADRVFAIRFRECRDCEGTEGKENPRIYPKIQTGCHTVRSVKKKQTF